MKSFTENFYLPYLDAGELAELVSFEVRSVVNFRRRLDNLNAHFPPWY